MNDEDLIHELLFQLTRIADAAEAMEIALDVLADTGVEGDD